MRLMSFWEHLEELRICVFKILLTVVGIGILTFLCGLREYTLFGFTIYYPFPDMYNNINTLVFNQVVADLLGGTGIILIQIGVADAMFIQMKISVFLGIALGMPMIVYQVYKFLAPAFKNREKTTFVKLAIPASILFILGILFAYVFIIPFSFDLLYGYTLAMGIEQTLSVNSFMSFVLLFTLAFGIVFELPVIQYGVTKIGLVEPDFWLRNWRYAFVAMIIFGAIITPDGSGITQLLIAVPMLGLYFIGYLVSRYAWSKQHKKK